MEKEMLFYNQKNVYDLMDGGDKKALTEYSCEYKRFLDYARTERLAVKYAVKMAEEHGFKPYEYGMEISPGDKLYVNNRGKSMMLAVIGKRPMSDGVNISASHIDAPRLDLKQVPLYEENDMAYLKTHYYGGIKKYQWVGIPLSLYGTAITESGESVDVAIGDSPDDPLFTITDLLPHLSADQYKKSLADGISGEGLNILFGSEPSGDEKDSDRVKLTVLSLLNEKYGLTETDFLSAEFEVVPAFETRDIGIDRGFLGGYGQDDRACAFAGLSAIIDLDIPDKTAVCVLADKEEIGSEGVTGMKSQVFEWFIEDLCNTQGTRLTTCFANSFCFSNDVCNGFDPNFPEVCEKRNSAKLNYGVAIMKYTGSRGKSGASDASAEIIGKLRKIFMDENVVWQMAELGKVDQGGGGTVAAYMAERNIDTVDAGMPLFSMHAPFEISSKADCYMTYKAISAVYKHC